MPKNVAIRQLLDCSEQEFWDRIFRCEEFNQYLYEGLGFEYELEEWNPETGYRRAKVCPAQQMPRAVARVLGERFSYVEEGKLDRLTGNYRFVVIPSTSAGRIRVQGTVSIQAVSPQQCERLVTLEIGADVLGLGRLIETYFAATTRAQYAKNAALVNDYLAGLH